MDKSSVIDFKKPDSVVYDPLTDLIRIKARAILSEALELEANEFIEHLKELKTSDGHQRVVRNGYLPGREIQTGVGAVSVKVPRVRDKEIEDDNEIVFQSKLIPKYLRKTKSMEALIPWLYLRGISTGDMSDAVAALVGENASGFSPTTISRLKEGWAKEHDDWSKRDISDKSYVYFWVDGVYCNVRMDDNKQCLLVIVGVTESGDKELVALEDGYRESEQSWTEVLLGLKQRGLKTWPKLAVGDGAIGFWQALRKTCPETKEQRCWMHKTGNILNRLPKTAQPKAKDRIHQIWMAETKENAEKAFDNFIETYEAKYPKATDCLKKDKESLLAFYDFPAQHWVHLRTTNPIESTFSTVRLRTKKARGCFSRTTALTMAFQLMRAAQKNWRGCNKPDLLPFVMNEIKFVDGLLIEDAA